MKLDVPEICNQPMEYIYKGYDGMYIPSCSDVPKNKKFEKEPCAILVIHAWNYCAMFIKTTQVIPRKAIDVEYELIRNAFNSQTK
jgi:hypothetical protein